MPHGLEEPGELIFLFFKRIALLWLLTLLCFTLGGNSKNFSCVQLSFPNCGLRFASQIGNDDVEQLEGENGMGS